MSDDGGATFIKALEFDLPEREYTQRTLNIDELAAGVGLQLTGQFVVRFQQHGAQAFTSTFSNGFSFDDFSVTGTFVPADMCVGLPATINGTDGDDMLVGTEFGDVIAGLAGNDVILGMGGNDIICAGKGVDIVFGGPGDDAIRGGAGNDVLRRRRGYPLWRVGR